MHGTKKRIPKLIVILPLCLLFAALMAWFALQWATRGPLAGEIRHDFGSIVIPATEPAILEHSFALTNRSNQPLTITAARPDCGCLAVNAKFPLTVGPRERLNLPITMKYQGSDRRGKTVHIQLNCGEAGMQSLWGRARPQK